jgi:acrylyl-CoA reductase (NADPH)
MDTFHALVARRDGDRITASVQTLRPNDLPLGDVTIRVLYSSVDYTDVLALTPGGGVVRVRPGACRQVLRPGRGAGGRGVLSGQ